MLDRIDIGQKEDDGSGDTLRDAFNKTNLNFDMLVERIVQRLSGGADAMRPSWPGEFVPRHVSDRAPDSTPPILGAIWIDTSDSGIYMATGTTAPEDWKRLAFVS